MALETVGDYITSARTLLQDEVEDYRYSTASLIVALNIGLQELRRVRPDLFRAYAGTTLPSFTTGDLATTVPVNEIYRPALLYYVCGYTQLRDDESIQDGRAAAFLGKFNALLTNIQA